MSESIQNTLELLKQQHEDAMREQTKKKEEISTLKNKITQDQTNLKKLETEEKALDIKNKKSVQDINEQMREIQKLNDKMKKA